MKRIIYETEEGLHVVIPAPNSGLTIEQVMAKDVPKGVSAKIVNTSVIPSDRYFRAAWKRKGLSAIEIDLPKAREIKKEKLREERKPFFEKLDVEFMIADEQNDTDKKTEIAIKKQALRDITNYPDDESDLIALKNYRPIIFDQV